MVSGQRARLLVLAVGAAEIGLLLPAFGGVAMTRLGFFGSLDRTELFNGHQQLFLTDHFGVTIANAVSE